MPYITKKQREELDPLINALSKMLLDHDTSPAVKGEYNYAITKLIHGYINSNGLRYHHLNDMIGVLECVKQELYRKKVAPYEETKILENGDVL